MQKMPLSVFLCETDVGSARSGAVGGAGKLYNTVLRQRIASMDIAEVEMATLDARDVGLEEGKSIEDIRHILVPIYRWYEASVERKRFPLLLSGEHWAAAATVAGFKSTAGGNACVLWVDAHPDLNTFATSPSMLPHGMALAAGIGLEERFPVWPCQQVESLDVCFFGTRSLDPGEIEGRVPSFKS